MDINPDKLKLLQTLLNIAMNSMDEITPTNQINLRKRIFNI